MNRPVDRLGQPLLVGDWVVIDGPCTVDEAIGLRSEISGFEVERYENGADGVEIVDPRDGVPAVVDSTSVRKISPPQKTTTWDKCDWQPEGLKV